VGVLLVVVPLPMREAAVRTGLAGNLFAGIDGLIAGAVAVVALVVFSAIYRQANLPDTTLAVPAVQDVHGTYVSLGDSYSSGEGLRPFSTTRPFCHRSLHSAYSVRLLAAIHPTPATDFVACSGAVTSDIFGGSRQQVDGRVHPEVGLVTITIGGNDVGFGDAVLDCFKTACLDAPFRALASDTTLPPPQALRTWAPKALVVLKGRLDALYARLRTEYPAARIVVLGYPHLFPRGAATWVPNDCASVLRRVSRSEREWIDNRTDDLNNLIYAEAVQHGLEFVSPADAWLGHEPCGTRGEYTNAVKPVLNYANPIDGGTFHPTVAGQHQFAALVGAYLAAHPNRPDQFSPGRHGPLRIGTDWCPSHLGLVPPPGQRVESCPADSRAA
jgi:lysophospholipase L1-like esterase